MPAVLCALPRLAAARRSLAGGLHRLALALAVMLPAAAAAQPAGGRVVDETRIGN